VTYIILFFIIVLLELVIVFVDGIVSKVHVQIIKIRIEWALVILCSKSDNTQFMNIDSQGVDSV